MNDRIDDLIALAALGELTDQETVELDAAVAADPHLAAELNDALASAAALQSSPAEHPPPELKTSVMQAITGVAQTSDATSAPPEPGLPAPTPLEPTPLAPDRRRAGRRWVPLLAAAAALLVVVGGVIVATSQDPADDPIAAVVEADDAVSHSVSGPIGELQFVYSPGEDAFVLVGDSLEPPADETTYQVWLVTDGEATSLGTFEPDSEGSMEMRADGLDPTGSTIGITVEPAGGSEEPTLPMVAQSSA
jgi:anti-sigma-K factor RskA